MFVSIHVNKLEIMVLIFLLEQQGVGSHGLVRGLYFFNYRAGSL